MPQIEMFPKFRIHFCSNSLKKIVTKTFKMAFFAGLFLVQIEKDVERGGWQEAAKMKLL